MATKLISATPVSPFQVTLQEAILLTTMEHDTDTSDASKAHSQEVLDSLPDQPHYGKEDQNISKNPNQVAGGLKA